MKIAHYLGVLTSWNKFYPCAAWGLPRPTYILAKNKPSRDVEQRLDLISNYQRSEFTSGTFIQDSSLASTDCSIKRKDVCCDEICTRDNREQEGESDEKDDHAVRADTVCASKRSKSPSNQPSDKFTQSGEENVSISSIKNLVHKQKNYGDAVPVFFEESNLPAFSLTILAKLLTKTLRTGTPHGVLRLILEVQNNGKLPDLLATLSPSVFSELLMTLDPRHFVGRLSDLFMECSPRMAIKLGLLSQSFTKQEGTLKFSQYFVNSARNIIRARSQSWELVLSDYKFLLKSARATGNLPLAQIVWQAIQLDVNITPDKDCFNDFMAIICGEQEFHNVFMRYRLAVVEKNISRRNWPKPPYQLAGHKVGMRGIKFKVLHLYREMVKSGIIGDEETFCHLIIAMAREADLDGVYSILMLVWGIDTNWLMTNDVEKPAKMYQRDSPLYPTDHLLFAIAHSFGANRAIPTALRLLDHISQQYSIFIPLHVWREVFRWTYVSSVQGTFFSLDGVAFSAQQKNFIEKGQICLPPDAITRLWETMTSEPYNIKPTLQMYDWLIVNLIRRQLWDKAMYQLNAAYESSLTEFNDLWTSYNNLLRNHDPELWRDIDEEVRNFFYAQLRAKRNRQYIRRWLDRYVQSGSRILGSDPSWYAWEIPNIVKDWGNFLPHKYVYHTVSGIVTIYTRSEQRFESKKQFLETGMMDPSLDIWNLLDTSDRDDVINELKWYQNSIDPKVSKPSGQGSSSLHRFEKIKNIINYSSGCNDDDDDDDSIF